MQTTDHEKAALVLLSGGLDSAVTALSAKSLGYGLHGLTFVYGQRHEVETKYAALLAQTMGFISHRVLELSAFLPGNSALTDGSIEVPKHRIESEIDGGGIPITYVPARNTIFLAYAVAFCEQLGLEDVFLGVNSLDYSGYPDCRPEFLRAFEELAALATQAAVEEGRRVRIRAPLLHRTKADIIRLGNELGLDFTGTWSCYDPVFVPTEDGEKTAVACGACDSCLLRQRGFHAAGVLDPTPYRSGDDSSGHNGKQG